MGRENEVSREIVDAGFHLHKNLGPGLLESVYEAILARDLESRGLSVVRQKPVPLNYEGMHFDEGFRADLVVDGCVIIELKSIEKIHPLHSKQLLTYLRLTGFRLGLLMNFNVALFKDGVKRIANGLPENPT